MAGILRKKWSCRTAKATLAANQLMPRTLPLTKSETAAAQSDYVALLDQLGSAFVSIHSPAENCFLDSKAVVNAATLRHFLNRYVEDLLLEIELPAIIRAHAHCSRNELRELLVLDKAFKTESRFKSFASASRRAGRSQLRKLKPLRENRFVQRYVTSCQKGVSSGWHTLVYGIFLATYSIPLRQGLLHYSNQTLAAFVDQASNGNRLLPQKTCDELLGEITCTLPSIVEKALAPHVSSKLSIVL